MYEDVLRGLEPPPKKVEGAMMRTASSMVHCLPIASTQRAALLAAICSSQSRKKAESYLGTLGPVQYTTSRDNAGFIALGHDIERPPKTRLNYEKGAVEACVRNMLLHTDQESWGQTHYHIPNLVTTVNLSDGTTPLWKPGDDTTVPLPRLRREAGVNESYRMYLQSCGVCSTKNKKDSEGEAIVRQCIWDLVDELFPPRKIVGECAHGQLLHAVTADQRKARAGVNYVEGNHLHDPLEKLYRVAEELSTWDAKLKLGGLRCFLKSNYLHRHAGKGSCASHSDRHSLFCEESLADPCPHCQLPYLILTDLKLQADEKHHPLIDDCAGHFKRYMAYQLRVANARAGIAVREAEQTVDDVVEQMDYMMTFQSLYGIETTVKFFGKRGILMHGTEAHFLTTSGTKQTHYFNHISLHDMKQDWRTVLALFRCSCRTGHGGHIPRSKANPHSDGV